MKVSKDLTELKKFVVGYVYNFDYDGTDDWVYSWTFPKALLFTLTIMTTIGELKKIVKFNKKIS